MPIMLYVCNNPECDNEISKYYNSIKKIAPFLDCGQCGTGKLEKQLGAPNSHKTQIIDNGLQAKKVELMDSVVEKEQDRLYKGE